MRIAFFTESLYPNTDGVSHTFNHLIQTLEKEKIDYRFYSPFKPENNVFWASKVRKMYSVPFPLYAQYKVSIPIIDNPREDLDRFNPDIIHVAAPTLLSLYAIRYAKKRSRPVVASYHTHWVPYFSYYGFKAMERLGWQILRWFHNKCSVTYAPTRSALRILKRAGIKHLELWERGIDLEHFCPQYRNEDLRKKISPNLDPVLLFVGRLVKEKDIDDLVQANKILQTRDYRFKMVFVGNGPMLDDVKRELPEAYCAGYLDGEALSEMYASSDIFVFPSTTETFGNVVQEAFASGLPAIGVRKGGVMDLITDGYNGLLAKPNHPQNLASHIATLLKDGSLREKMSQHALDSVADRSWDATNRRLIESYYRLVQR